MASVLKKGGQGRYVLSNIATGQTFTIPRGMKIDYIAVEALSTTAGNISVGKAGATTEIVGSVAAPTTVGQVNSLTIAKNLQSLTADYTALVTITGGKLVNLYVQLSKVN